MTYKQPPKVSKFPFHLLLLPPITQGHVGSAADSHASYYHEGRSNQTFFLYYTLFMS